ncbi:hypothetical protein PG997_005025 [Apiospora hydei]|uniref:Uncharacterized protein n=1 Tax=Apiospora hydei TaxID=1337664 RepID=A0ABR1X3Y3_9PEZI
MRAMRETPCYPLLQVLLRHIGHSAAYDIRRPPRDAPRFKVSDDARKQLWSLFGFLSRYASLKGDTAFGKIQLT